MEGRSRRRRKGEEAGRTKMPGRSRRGCTCKDQRWGRSCHEMKSQRTEQQEQEGKRNASQCIVLKVIAV